MLNKFLFASPLISAISLIPFAHAQVAADPQVPAAAAEGTTEQSSPAPGGRDVGNEIIVTASKREQNLQDVPIAVTAIPEAKLKSLNVVSVAELVNIAPSLKFNQTTLPGSSQFIIRGVGTYAFNEGLEPSVGVVVDGIPLGRSTGAISDTVDVAQVQVLRGPQGTIFGKNATAGVIDIRFRDAELDETSFDGRAYVGSYSEHRWQGTVNIPIVPERVAIRASAWRFTRDGYIRAPLQPDGDVGDFNNRGARMKVALKPLDALRIDLTGEISRNDADGTPQTPRGYATDAERATLQPRDLSVGIIAGPNIRTSGVEAELFARLRQYRFTGKAVYDLGGASITAVSGYFNTDLDSRSDPDTTNSLDVYNRTNVQPGLAHYFGNINQFTSELRLASEGARRLQYTVGLFYYDLEVLRNERLQNSIFTPGTRTASDGRVNVKTKNYAAFADVTYDIGQIRLLAGGRYSHERTRGTYDRGVSQEYRNVDGGPLAILNGQLNVVTPTNKFNDFSWRVGAQYRPTDDLMFYATASRGYKGPGLNYTLSLNPETLALNGGVVDAEIAHSYEIGMRSQLFDRQLTLNLTGFYSPFTDFQVTAALPTVPATFTTVNAGELLAKGVELEFFVRPDALPGFTLDGSVVWNDTTYEDFKNAPCLPVGIQARAAAPTDEPGICAPIAVGSTSFIQNVSGFRAVGAPEWQVNLTPRYERDIGASFRGFGQAHFQYNSSVQYGISNNPITIQKGYHTIDLTAGFGDVDRRWTLSAYARNITKERYVTRIAFTQPGIGQLVPFQALRTYGVALDVSF
ncbi:MAG TPA: TonB-dependent receptor [Propylenella sp.]|nr:TonB-dependent receptor [Propylenella sp.]